MKAVMVALVLGALGGCAHKAEVLGTSAAYEVMSDRKTAGTAYVIVSDDLAQLERVVKPGFACGAHSYPVSFGPAIRSSIARTVEAAFQDAIVLTSESLSPRNGAMFAFKLDEFNPRLRFIPGFFVPTADASVEFAMRVSATNAAGKIYSTTTVRGTGQATEDGGCEVGASVLAVASQKALRVALESFVSRVINIDGAQQANKAP